MQEQINLSPQSIQDHYKNNQQAIPSEHGGLQFNPNATRELSHIGSQVHNLTFESLRAALIGVQNSCLFPGPWLITTQDIFHTWAWCAQLILDCRSEKYEDYDDAYDFKQQLTNATIALFANKINSNTELLPHYDRLLVGKSFDIFPYLTFPLLETTLRMVSKQYINQKGIVTKDFIAYKKTGGIKRRYAINDKCSSARDLLDLYYRTTDQEQKEKIDECLTCIGAEDTYDALNQIYDWRNGFMHGSEITNFAGCSVLTLCFLILLHFHSDEFEAMREQAFYGVWHAGGERRADWSFYPPF